MDEAVGRVKVAKEEGRPEDVDLELDRLFRVWADQRSDWNAATRLSGRD